MHPHFGVETTWIECGVNFAVVKESIPPTDHALDHTDRVDSITCGCEMLARICALL